MSFRRVRSREETSKRLVVLMSMMLASTWPIAVPAAGNLFPAVTHQIDFNAEEVQIESNADYDVITYTGGGLDRAESRAGAPQLPIVVRWFLLPPDTKVDEIQFTATSWDTLPGTYLPVPIQSENTEGYDGPEPGIYNSDNAFPATPHVLAVDSSMRGYHLGKVVIYPLQYLPDAEKLVLMDEGLLSLRLRELTAEEDERRLVMRRPETRDSREKTEVKWILRRVENPEQFEAFYPRSESYLQATQETPIGGFAPTEWPSLEGSPIRFLIITNNSTVSGEGVGDMVSVFGDWASWRTQQGLEAAVVSVQDIIEQWSEGEDQVERIRYYLRTAYRDWGTEWVLLGGDVNIVPTRFLGGPDTDQDSEDEFFRPDPPADGYYALLDEDWNADRNAYIGETYDSQTGGDFGLIGGLPDVWIGRIPARNALEASVIMSKIGGYELRPDSDFDPPPTSYYKTVLAAAGPLNSGALNVQKNGIYFTETWFLPEFPSGWDRHRLYPEVPVFNLVCPDSVYYECYEDLREHVLNIQQGDYDSLFTWVGDELAEFADMGYHFIWHVEHSERWFWGTPSGTEARPGVPGGSGCDSTWQKACADALENVYAGITKLTREQVLSFDAAQTQAKFSIVLNNGSWNNMFDRDAISEAFLRAPSGGAVAYIGKSSAEGDIRYESFSAILDEIFDEDNTRIGQALNFAIQEEFEDFQEHREAWILPLMGDPTMDVWTGVPGELEATVSPSTITSLGSQTITVTVRKKNELTVVPGARVCMKQGDRAYAVKMTDSSGKAQFKGYSVLVQSPVIDITVTAHDYKPYGRTLSIGDVAPKNVYHSHEITETGDESDGDGDLEPFESLHLRVVVENAGDSTSTGCQAHLWPTPSVWLDLDVNGVYRHDRVYIGRDGAHPEGSTERFRVPLSWDGYRAEGEPTIAQVNDESYKVWRVSATGLYSVETASPFGSEDSVFTGILKTVGSFEDVSMVGEGADDYFWSGDSIWFRFYGDVTPDKMTFRAAAPNWIDLVDSTSYVGTLTASDTASARFDLQLSETVPDGQNLVFTLAVKDTLDRWSHSDFLVEVKAPELHPLVLERTTGDFLVGCDTSMVVAPVLYNWGSAEADSAVLVLHKTGGTVTVVDSVATFPGIGPKTLATALDSIWVCASEIGDFDDFTYTLEVQTYMYQDYYADAVEVEEGGGPSGGGPEAPDGLVLHAGGNSLTLIWEPVEGADRYVVYWKPTQGNPVFLGVAEFATRFEVSELSPGVSYTFQVRACDGLQCGAAAEFDPGKIWLQEHDGWPKSVHFSGLSDQSGATSIKAYDLDGDGDLEIFAAGTKIYGWFHDGTPLAYDSEDGLLYDPGTSEGPNHAFTEALAFADGDGASETLIVGNIRDVGLQVIAVNPDASHEGYWVAELVYQKDIASPISAPVVAPLAGLESPWAVLITADSTEAGAADTLYAWRLDTGETWNTDQGAPLTGAIIGMPDTSGTNYRGLAVCEDPDNAGECDIIQTTRKGNVYRFDGWRLTTYYPRAAQDLQNPDAILSTPTVGDVDGDGDEEVVVTNFRAWNGSNDAEVYVLSVDDLSVEATGSCSGCVFTSDSGSLNPPWGAALVNIDSDEDLEIIVTGFVRGGQGSDPNWPYRHEIYVFNVEHGEEGYSLSDAEVCSMAMPLPGRKDGYVRGTGTPVVAELDGWKDPTYEIITGNSMGGLSAWTWNRSTSECEQRQGWPIILTEIPLEPMITKVDSGDDRLNLLVQTGGGEIHVFDLPSTTYTPVVEWSMYGYDYGNTRRYGGVEAILDGGGDDERRFAEHKTYPSLGSPNPVPFNPIQRISFYVPSRQDVSLKVYDIGGRLVKTIEEGLLDEGTQLRTWTGVDDRGAPVATGVYFYRIRIGSYEDTRKTMMLK